MQKYNRNNKEHQRQRMQDIGEAEHTILEFHGLPIRPGTIGVSVGRMLNVSNSIGLGDRSIVQLKTYTNYAV